MFCSTRHARISPQRRGANIISRRVSNNRAVTHHSNSRVIPHKVSNNNMANKEVMVSKEAMANREATVNSHTEVPLLLGHQTQLR